MYMTLILIVNRHFVYIFIDHFGTTNKYFAIAGSNDTDAKSATTILTTPGFKGNEHPRECLNFWYNIKVVMFFY